MVNIWINKKKFGYLPGQTVRVSQQLYLNSWVDKYIKAPMLEKGVDNIIDFGYFETLEYLKNE